jgi:catechol 2,3-dioxygenase-like lactoylglutathione lyase family enzyme
MAGHPIENGRMKGPMTSRRPVSVTLYVRDREAAIRFYESALGMRWNPDIWSFQFGEYPRDDFFLVSIIDSADGHARPIGAGHFGYSVEDVDASHRRLLDAGAREWYPPHDNPGAPRSSGLEDPDGNRVELWQA